MKEKIKLVTKKQMIIPIIVVGFLLILIGTFLNSYAYITPIKTIFITSKSLSYENKDPASFQIEKSAEWIERNKARVTFNVNSYVEEVEYAQNIVLALDLASIKEMNMEELKESTKGLLDYVFSSSNKSVALLTFSDEVAVLSKFTKDKETLVNQIESLSRKTSTGVSHYEAMLKLQEIFDEYTNNGNVCSQENECRVLMVTSGKPSIGKPNEVAEYQNLKGKYPELIFSLVQYDIGSEVIKELERISDIQYTAEKGNLAVKMLKASGLCKEYSKFLITDNIDTTYFTVDSSSIDSTMGKATLSSDGNTLSWDLNDYRTSFDATLTVDLTLKEEYKNKKGHYSVGESTQVEAVLDSYQDNITSELTPILFSYYQVSYEMNAPDGCSVSGTTPPNGEYQVFERVEKLGENLKCGDYKIDSWNIATEGVEILNDDYFVMPEHDVVIRAVWSKLSIVKKVEGEIQTVNAPVIQSVTYNYQEKLWKYKENITKVVFQNQIKSLDNEVEIFDVSDAQDGSVIARVTTNDTNTSLYTVYIQGEGGVLANENSANLFDGFSKVESIEGLELFDTSNAKTMDSMFSKCPALKILDLSHFDTSNVENMTYMFLRNTSLTEINLSSFDTTKVTNMKGMFQECSTVTSLDLSTFNTAQVTSMENMFHLCSQLSNLDIHTLTTDEVINMSKMFNGCSSLPNLDLSHFNTTKVTNMYEMFRDCNNLTTLNITSFDTTGVIAMRGMFQECQKLGSIDLSHFSTQNADDLSYLFRNCKSLTTLDVSTFDTTNVTQMFYMFEGCCLLTSLDVSNFNTSKVDNMLGMFENCENITSLDLSNFDTSNVQRMDIMFASCKKLTTLDISNFDTSKVRFMKQMFAGTGLSSLDLSHFDTSNVEDMSYMFFASGNLTDLNVTSFNTSKVKTMEFMFGALNNIVSLDIRNFDTSNVILMNSMFAYDYYLQNIDLSHFDFSQVINTGQMFDSCLGLKATININSTTIVTYQNMFNNAAKIDGSQITVNYTSATSGLVDQLIATKSPESKVVKGTLIS